tara:strand:+ start:2945 stop:3382 length:438 start_codon:yes stop_codon:yes gene_type:complete
LAQLVPFTAKTETRPEIRFLTEQDDFSIKVSVDDDPIFWVRLETAAAGPQVTDFNPGAQPADALARGLSLAVRTARMTDLGQLLFLDMVRGGVQPNGGPAMLQARTRVEQAVVPLADELGLTVTNIGMRERRGKIDFTVNFGPAR